MITTLPHPLMDAIETVLCRHDNGCLSSIVGDSMAIESLRQELQNHRHLLPETKSEYPSAHRPKEKTNA